MLARAAIVLTVLLISHLPFGQASAQDVDRIAAVVNDEIISLRDLDARMKLAITVSGLPDNIENRRRAVPQVLRKMIDERLQSQEAARLKVTAGSEEVMRGLANIENQNRMQPGSLLPSLVKAGVDPDAVKEQVKADIIWVKLIMRSLQPTIRVGEDEITERIEAIRQQFGQPEFMLAEIFLPVESPRQEEESRRLGERLIEQLRAGAPFQALARQFSQSGTAANGGVLGWLAPAAIEDDIRDVVMRLDKGQVSPLVRTGTGYSIIALIDKRVTGETTTSEPKFALAQVFFPIPPGAPPIQQLAAKAAELTAPLKSCTEMEDMGRKLNSQRSGVRDGLSLSVLPQAMRPVVSGLPLNKASAPMNTGDALLVVMVCSREEGVTNKGGLPTREAMKRAIEDERLDMMSRRYLRDLRRAAFIDFRL